MAVVLCRKHPFLCLEFSAALVRHLAWFGLRFYARLFHAFLDLLDLCWRFSSRLGLSLLHLGALLALWRAFRPLEALATAAAALFAWISKLWSLAAAAGLLRGLTRPL